MAAAMACPMVRPTKNAASQIARELTLSQANAHDEGTPRLVGEGQPVFPISTFDSALSHFAAQRGCRLGQFAPVSHKEELRRLLSFAEANRCLW
jgi:hypothetical protein